VTGNCNTTSGECSNCGYNTTGYNCQWCASGFYGNALNRTCKRKLKKMKIPLCNKTLKRASFTCFMSLVYMFYEPRLHFVQLSFEQVVNVMKTEKDLVLRVIT
jgi:hypothetical protein